MPFGNGYRSEPDTHHDKTHDSMPDGPKKWAIKIEFLLESKKGLELFIKYCKSTFCEENIIFWYDVRQFKNGPESDVS